VTMPATIMAKTNQTTASSASISLHQGRVRAA